MKPSIGKPIVAREPSRAELESELRHHQEVMADYIHRGVDPDSYPARVTREQIVLLKELLHCLYQQTC